MSSVNSSVNYDVVSEYVDVRRALMVANHSNPSAGMIDRTIAHLESYLSRPMRVVVLGEHNSGKTSLINAMLGREMLPTAVVANTPVSVTMRYGSVASIRAQTGCGEWHEIDHGLTFNSLSSRGLRAVEVRAPNLLLKRFELVDTPAGHDRRSHVLGADFVIWCTNATRAWSETERRAWVALPRRCRRYGLLAATHTDALGSLSDRDKVLSRLSDVTGDLFEDIRLVCNAGRGDSRAVGSGNADGSGVNELLRRLEEMSNAQRARRVLAAGRIASRLNRVIDISEPHGAAGMSGSDMPVQLAS